MRMSRIPTLIHTKIIVLYIEHVVDVLLHITINYLTTKWSQCRICYLFFCGLYFYNIYQRSFFVNLNLSLILLGKSVSSGDSVQFSTCSCTFVFIYFSRIFKEIYFWTAIRVLLTIT